jgi:hypothetical protein|tara:strand:+ start:1501 stop:1743 length:243 start_codon:yes stop_codon:yes gene_type:complete
MKNKAERITELVESYNIESYNEGIDVGGKVERERVIKHMKNVESLFKGNQDIKEALAVLRKAITSNRRENQIAKTNRDNS